MKFIRKNIKSILLILIILFFVNFLSFNKNFDIAKSQNKNKIKISQNSTFKSILIDNDDENIGNGTWANAKDDGWVSGEGTWEKPYVLENITIEGDFTTNGIEIRNSNVPFVIKNCNISHTGTGDINDGAIKLDDVYNGTIYNNNCSYNNASGIFLDSSGNNSIIDNQATNNNEYTTRHGIYLRGSDKNTIEYNKISENYYGIYIRESNNNTIYNNEMKDNQNGIQVYYKSDRNLIEENSIEGGSYGIYLINDCLNNTISDNEIIDKYRGITIENSCNNSLITNNLIKNNRGYGIDIINSSNLLCYDTLVYENVFNNPDGKNAQDNGTNTKWDNGAIGNYWHDYPGKDLNDDGIGDTPYVIDTYRNIKDNFPIFSDGDDIPPQITINSPTENTTFGIMAPEFSIDISDPNLDKCWYTINNGETTFNFTNSTIRIDQVEWEKALDGIVNCSFYGNDTNGNQNSLTIKLIKDTLLPALDFKGTNINGTTIQNSPNFTITITEKYLDSVWVKIYEKGANQTFIQKINTSNMLNVAANSDSYDIPIQINETTWNSFQDGEIELTVYANDTVGNIGSMNILITKGSSTGSGDGIPFGSGYMIITIIALVSTILVYKTKRKKSIL